MQKWFKVTTLFLLVIVLAIAAGCGGGAAQDTSIVATVNGDEITKSDVNNKYEMTPLTEPLLGRTGFTPEQQKNILLFDLIDQTIIQQKAEAEDIKVANEQLETRYKLFRTGRTREQLIKELEAMGLTEQALLDNLKNQCLKENYFNKILKPRKVTEKEAKAYYEKNKKKLPPSLTYAEARALIIPRLEETKWADAQEEWLDQARRDSDIRLYAW